LLNFLGFRTLTIAKEEHGNWIGHRKPKLIMWNGTSLKKEIIAIICGIIKYHSPSSWRKHFHAPSNFINAKKQSKRTKNRKFDVWIQVKNYLFGGLKFRTPTTSTSIVAADHWTQLTTYEKKNPSGRPS
jgi:hypothetical protein